MADDLKRNNGFIPGVKPGQPTADYIGTIMDRITLPGAVLLAVVGILPGIAQLLGVTPGICYFLWRNVIIDYGSCYFGYTSTNRNAIIDAAIRRVDEFRSHPGKTVCCTRRNRKCLIILYRVYLYPWPKMSGFFLNIMIIYKTQAEIELIRESCLLVNNTIAEIAKHVKPGITTLSFQ